MQKTQQQNNKQPDSSCSQLPTDTAERNLPGLKSLHTHEEEKGTESQALGNLISWVQEHTLVFTTQPCPGAGPADLPCLMSRLSTPPTKVNGRTWFLKEANKTSKAFTRDLLFTISEKCPRKGRKKEKIALSLIHLFSFHS